MSIFSIEGRIKSIFPVEKGVSKAGKGWSKQKFTLETEEKYPQVIAFSVFNGNPAIESWMKGAKAKITFTVNGREYKDKDGNLRNITELSAWKIEADERRRPQPEPEPEPQMEEEDPDLPF